MRAFSYASNTAPDALMSQESIACEPRKEEPATETNDQSTDHG